MQEAKQFKKKHRKYAPKVRKAYKEVITIAMKVQEGTKIVLDGYAIHASKIKKDIETGSYILEFQYHKMGNRQTKRANETEYIVKKNVRGGLYLEKVNSQKEEVP